MLPSVMLLSVMLPSVRLLAVILPTVWIQVGRDVSFRLPTGNNIPIQIMVIHTFLYHLQSFQARLHSIPLILLALPAEDHVTITQLQQYYP
jgi:hypothetical protein